MPLFSGFAGSWYGSQGLPTVFPWRTAGKDLKVKGGVAPFFSRLTALRVIPRCILVSPLSPKRACFALPFPFCLNLCTPAFRNPKETLRLVMAWIAPALPPTSLACALEDAPAPLIAAGTAGPGIDVQDGLEEIVVCAVFCRDGIAAMRPVSVLIREETLRSRR
jgi:hypothetical protein